MTKPPPATTTHTESEPNDVTAQLLGTLGATDFVVGGTASSDTDVDLYRLTLATASNIHITLAWTGSQDLVLSLMDSSLVLFHQQDTASNPETMSHNGIPAGSWVVRVTSHTAGAAAYTLTIGKH